ncbi:MAG: hypothetical protein R3211_02875 [Balneolaceae bacterium]|nr:hypothetical protein [Balneolaceae bacterium]
MKPLVISLDTKTFYISFIYFVFFASGLFIIGGHIYNYFYHTMMENWFFNFLVGLCFFLWGILGFFGRSPLVKSELIIDEEGIRSNKSHFWIRSVAWPEVDSVSLDKKYIHVTYRDSGAEDKIRLPIYTDKQFEQIRDKLKETTAEFDLKYQENVDH